MRIAVVGLNPGTAVYAYHMAKDGHEVTVYTGMQGDVVIMDLMPQMLLGIVGRETTRLFTRKYLEDALGVSIMNTEVGRLRVGKGRVVDESRGVESHFDKVIVGSEVIPRSGGECLSIYAEELKSGDYVINGEDAGKSTEALLLIAELGGTAITKSRLALDEDVLKSLQISKAGGAGQCLSTDYEVVKPLVTDDVREFVGRGFVLTDPLSGVDYVVERDYQVMIMGRLLALRDLGIINSIPQMPRLEVGFSRDWSFMSIGLTRSELAGVFRDLSSSRVALHSDGGDVVGKVLHMGRRLLGLQLLVRGVRLLNWFYHVYSLVMLDRAPFLMLDMGYERLFGTLRGVLEELILNVYNI